ncbi:MAG: FkbM family methyltransferase, partial [Opitutus sp.]
MNCMSREITIARFLMRIRPAPVAAFLKMLLGVRRREIMTPVGRFWIDPASVLGLELLEHGIHERDVTQAIRQLLRPEDTFVDIGANEGYFAVLASVFVGERGRVIAVEPQSRLQEVLARNFTLNDCRNIVVERVAVSDRPSSARLKLTPSMNNSASGFAPAAIYPLPSESVQCIRLADLLARHNV